MSHQRVLQTSNLKTFFSQILLTFHDFGMQNLSSFRRDILSCLILGLFMRTFRSYMAFLNVF